MSDVSNLVLGTAQLGMDYGVANVSGQPNCEESFCIVKQALDGGIQEFDTARAYGDSEIVLGSCLKPCGSEVRVVTKLAPEVDCRDYGEVLSGVKESLRRLQSKMLYGVMLHRESVLALWDQGVGKVFDSIKKAGLIQNLGVSVYSPEKAMQALELDGLNMIQVPGNVFDRRFEKEGFFEAAKASGRMVYVRSIFLQGLCFFRPENLPFAMNFAAEIVARFCELAESLGLSPHTLCLAYAREAYPGCRVLVGAETVEQIVGNIEAWTTTVPNDLVARVRQAFPDVDERIVNPALWKE